jgi:hypothetical protein
MIFIALNVAVISSRQIIKTVTQNLNIRKKKRFFIKVKIKENNINYSEE